MKKVFLTTAMFLLLGTGCLRTSTTQPDGKKVAFEYGQDITLKIDETASFADGLRVQLKTINDSRCKPDVVCIWAGELGATLQMQVGDGASVELILGMTTKPMASALGYDVTLVKATETTATISVTK